MKKEDLKRALRALKEEGYRLITISVLPREKHFEVIYHLARRNKVRNIRFFLQKNQVLPSVRDIFPNSWIYEWEEHEKTGIKVENAKRLFEIE